jgi:hypothetical protein
LKSLSVIVIGKNEEAYITDPLRSVQAAIAEVGEAEVVYVDSASVLSHMNLIENVGLSKTTHEAVRS